MLLHANMLFNVLCWHGTFMYSKTKVPSCSKQWTKSLTKWLLINICKQNIWHKICEECGILFSELSSILWLDIDTDVFCSTHLTHIPYIYLHGELLHSSMSFWQCCPPKPSIQTHWYDAMLSTQVAPFWHGSTNRRGNKTLKSKNPKFPLL